ncbi:energy transducer TonB [Cupriavidus sp. AU9028]|uniref:energy transducer TonB family protein n=1 Tax=Cupriavidus sp. AU9028 TaxID=2871157 RepID=UPI001C937787|nr:energy transducer TonB [Cupriavidus sp. AU9028]MBY4897507.1 energy transducer TonB [Cupriavidus sp. AU9028]
MRRMQAAIRLGCVERPVATVTATLAAYATALAFAVPVGLAGAQTSNPALEQAAQQVSEAVAVGEVIAAAQGTVRQQTASFTAQRAACVTALDARQVANRIGYPLAKDFSREEFVALADFLATAAGARIQQARAARLASGNLTFQLEPQEAALVRAALPEPLARKWIAGAAMQPYTVRAMRAVFAERQAICRHEETSSRPQQPAPVSYREGLPLNVNCSQPRLTLVSALPGKPVSVTVRVWIGADGTVARSAVDKESGWRPVDDAARRAMNGMRCAARGGGELTPFTTTQTFVVRAGG